MPVIICPNCKHRMLTINPTCPSCGYGLSPSPFTSAATASRVPPPTPMPPPLSSTSSVPPAPVSVVPAGGTSIVYPPKMLEGLVVDPPSTHESPYIVGNRMWDGPEFRTQVTTVRIKRADGTMRDARIEGYLGGANLSLGDHVTLHGKDRDGTLIVAYGYNHSANGHILIYRKKFPIFQVIAKILKGV